MEIGLQLSARSRWNLLAFDFTSAKTYGMLFLIHDFGHKEKIEDDDEKKEPEEAVQRSDIGCQQPDCFHFSKAERINILKRSSSPTTFSLTQPACRSRIATLTAGIAEACGTRSLPPDRPSTIQRAGVQGSPLRNIVWREAGSL
jgi:hypothetical protein